MHSETKPSPQAPAFLGAFLLSFLFVLTTSLFGQEVRVATPVQKSLSAAFVNSMGVLNDNHKLGPGDTLSFRVLEDEEPPTVLIVTDSGEMEVPYIGRFSAAGKSCKTAAYEIKSALEKEYYYQASVIIGLDVIAPRGVVSRGRIYLMGQVRSQGPQEIPAGEVYTVSKAILRAGGFGEYANKRKVKLIRKSGGAGESNTTIVDLVEVLEKGKTSKDMTVEPDDLIIVPERLINF